MRSRTSGCCQAAGRHLRTSKDAVWISDDVLSTAFHRFCKLHTQFRRHGSSVPGPLEFRRRLGKRRLTASSEAPPSMLQDFGTVWGFATPGADRTSWQWQAPSVPNTSSKSSLSFLPAWLGNISEHSNSETVPQDQFWPMHGQYYAERKETRDFLSRLSVVEHRDVKQLCIDFNRNIYRNIRLGHLSDNTILWVLENVPRQSAQAFHGGTVDTQHLALRLYQAVWNGLRDRTLLHVSKIDGKLLQALFLRICTFKSDTVIQSLIRDILDHISPQQCWKIRAGLKEAIKAWINTWLGFAKRHDRDTLDGRLEISTGFFHTHGDARLLRSSGRLALLLDGLPKPLQAQILPCITEYIVSSLRNNTDLRTPTIRRTFLYCWASTISKMSSTTESSILESWLDISNNAIKISKEAAPIVFSERERCELLLDFWIQRGWIPEHFRSQYHDVIGNPGDSLQGRAVMSLFHVLRNESVFLRNKISLILNSIDVSAQADIADIIQFCTHHSVALPATAILAHIRNLTDDSPRSAKQLLSRQLLLLNRFESVAPEDLSNIAVQAIQNKCLHSLQIFSALQVPVSNSTRFHAKQKSLTPDRIALIHKMALAFTFTDGYSQREKLRAVWRCAIYLKKHKAPITAEMSRALVRVGLVDELQRGKWIGGQKYGWLYDLVRKYEGEDVACVMDQAAYQFKAQHVNRARARRRYLNPLRMGNY